MDLVYEIGDPLKPRGHAIIYFRDWSNPEELYATYVVIPPVAIDFAKYVPPMMASRMPQGGSAALSCVPLPPIPEKVAGRGVLNDMAYYRDDDLLYAGTINPAELDAMLISANDAAQAYFKSYAEREPQTSEPEPESGDEGDVEEVLYSLMGDEDKLGELAKLAGKLGYATEGGDSALAEEAVAQMRKLVKHLPAKYRGEEFIEVAQFAGNVGRRLAELYMSRCYKLMAEDYAALADIEREIQLLRGESHLESLGR